MLLEDSITTEKLAQSTQLLRHYCFLFSSFYGKRWDWWAIFGNHALALFDIIVISYNYVGERHRSSNVHGLLHLSEVITKLGPLWAHSCSHLKLQLKMFHGSQAVEKQVCATYKNN